MKRAGPHLELTLRIDLRAAAIIVGALAVLPFALRASSVTLPYTFANDQVADAAQVNANFVAVRTGINDNDARLNAVEPKVTAVVAAEAADDARLDDILPQGGRHLKTQVVTTVYASGSDSGPEVYEITAAAGGPFACNATTRGHLFVGRASGAGSQDSLCACLNVDNAYNWWCFNP